MNTCVVCTGHWTLCAIFRAESRLKYARNLTVTDILPLSAQETFDITTRLQMLDTRRITAAKVRVINSVNLFLILQGYLGYLLGHLLDVSTGSLLDPVK